MNVYKWITGLLICATFTSCFKEEPLNAECDIEQVSIHVDNPLGIFFAVSDTIQRVNPSDDVITFRVRRNHIGDLSTIQPNFVLTPGATITQLSNTLTSDKGGMLTYRVTSEDRQWSRNYTVSIQPVVRTVNDTIAYDFENFELEPKGKKYYVWHNTLEDGTLGNDWANGNPGFSLSKGSAKPEEYPSTPLKDGYDGYGIQLTTRSTGRLAALFGKPIAAGNFFLGSFDMSQALTDANKATSFGVPFDRQPITMTGYYKYKPGPIYKDQKGNIIPDRTDEAAIHAVLYRNRDEQGNPVMLHGNDVKTNSHIVAIADMGKVPETETWTSFSITFDYSSPIDYTLLEEQGYNLTIVLSSSKEGKEFQGAVDSQLCIDRLRIICKKEEENKHRSSN
ncbi:MAG: PCMD domain-containing protein [Prevotella sp.]|jgi:hypothetical protein